MAAKAKQGIIYLAINRINGKPYVGKTVDSLNGRRKSHEKDLRCIKRSYWSDMFNSSAQTSKMKWMLTEISEVGLICLMARMTGEADTLLGTGTAWTMFLYEHMDHVDIKFAYWLQDRLNERLTERGLPNVSLIVTEL